jgi:hypothetical protein
MLPNAFAEFIEFFSSSPSPQSEFFANLTSLRSEDVSRLSEIALCVHQSAFTADLRPAHSLLLALLGLLIIVRKYPQEVLVLTNVVLVLSIMLVGYSLGGVSVPS